MRLALALLLGFWSFPAFAAELIMIEQIGCVWCKRFDAEIVPAYSKTDEGKRAPLRRVDLFQPLPPGLTVKEGARFTPTFILVDDTGLEVGRFIGYPGEEFFYSALGDLLKKLPQP